MEISMGDIMTKAVAWDVMKDSMEKLSQKASTERERRIAGIMVRSMNKGIDDARASLDVVIATAPRYIRKWLAEGKGAAAYE